MNGWQESTHEEGRKEKVLTEAHRQTLCDLHRKVKGTYLQIAQLMHELDLLTKP